MSDSLTSWLAKAVVQHDRVHGANLQASRTSSAGWLVQITEFHTYRTTSHPRAQIKGIVCDKTHHVQVEYDVDATDRFEAADTDLLSETLTSCKRAILAIKSYRWKLVPPNRRRSADGRLELPIVVMEILDFAPKEGDRHWPNLQENTVDIGRGERDGEVQKILRKWFFGESHSSQSQADKSFELSQPEAGPSRLSTSSQARIAGSSRLPAGIIPLSTFLEPYLSETGSKKGKTIPDWIFDMSDENRQALNQVGMFGLDFDESPPTVSSPSTKQHRLSLSPSPEPDPEPDPEPEPSQSGAAKKQPSSPNIRLDKGKQKAQPPASSAHSPSQRSERRMPSATQYATPPVPLGQRLSSTQTATQQIPDSPGADAEDEDEAEAEESSDGEIPIRPRPRLSNTQRRPIFDPLNFDPSEHDAQNRVTLQPTFTSRLANTKRGRSEQRAEADTDAESTDSDLLSEYERSKRPTTGKKRRAVEPTLIPARTERTNRTEAIADAVAQPTVAGTSPDKPIVIDDESIPASESLESYSLSKQYPSPPKPNIGELRELESRESGNPAAVAVPVTPVAATISRSRAIVNFNVDVTQMRTEVREARAVSPAVAIHTTTQFSQAPHDPDSLGSSKTGSGNTQSLPTPPPSDDQGQEETETKSTRRPDTVDPMPQPRAAAPSKSLAPRPIKRESTVHTGPSPVRPTPSRVAPAASDTGAVRQTGSGPGPGQPSLVLNLTVDGLSEDTVQQYIARIRAARDRQRPRAP